MNITSGKLAPEIISPLLFWTMSCCFRGSKKGAKPCQGRSGSLLPQTGFHPVSLLGQQGENGNCSPFTTVHNTNVHLCCKDDCLHMTANQKNPHCVIPIIKSRLVTRNFIFSDICITVWFFIWSCTLSPIKVSNESLSNWRFFTSTHTGVTSKQHVNVILQKYNIST